MAQITVNCGEISSKEASYYGNALYKTQIQLEKGKYMLTVFSYSSQGGAAALPRCAIKSITNGTSTEIESKSEEVGGYSFKLHNVEMQSNGTVTINGTANIVAIKTE